MQSEIFLDMNDEKFKEAVRKLECEKNAFQNLTNKVVWIRIIPSINIHSRGDICHLNSSITFRVYMYTQNIIMVAAGETPVMFFSIDDLDKINYDFWNKLQSLIKESQPASIYDKVVITKLFINIKTLNEDDVEVINDNSNNFTNAFRMFQQLLKEMVDTYKMFDLKNLSKKK